MTLLDTIRELSNIRYLNREKLEKYVLFGAKYANKRITELKKRGLTDSRALKQLEDAGISKFPTKDEVKKIEFNKLKTLSKDIYRFLNSKTSTVSGARRDRAHRQDFFESIGRKYGEYANWKRVDDIFYRIWVGGLAQEFYSPSDLKKEIADYVYGNEELTDDEIVNRIGKQIRVLLGESDSDGAKPYYSDTSEATSKFFRRE